MPKPRARAKARTADPRRSEDDIEAEKRELEKLKAKFGDQPERELDKLLADKKTQVRVGQVIGDSVLFGKKKS